MEFDRRWKKHLQEHRPRIGGGEKKKKVRTGRIELSQKVERKTRGAKKESGPGVLERRHYEEKRLGWKSSDDSEHIAGACANLALLSCGPPKRRDKEGRSIKKTKEAEAKDCRRCPKKSGQLRRKEEREGRRGTGNALTRKKGVETKEKRDTPGSPDATLNERISPPRLLKLDRRSSWAEKSLSVRVRKQTGRKRPQKAKSINS